MTPLAEHPAASIADTMKLRCKGDWRPTARFEVLRRRAELLRAARDFFIGRGFLEVETPLLSADTIVDRHIDPLPVPFQPESTSRATGAPVVSGGEPLKDTGARLSPEGDMPHRDDLPCMWLQTSPEFAMKRLVAAGAQAIFQICKAFRRQERGPLHNPEFTLLEWYRVGDNLEKGMKLLGDLVEQVAGLPYPEFVTYQEIFRFYTGLDPHYASAPELATVADLHGVPAPEIPFDDADSWRDLLFCELVQPHLGWPRPVIVYNYPASQAGLACVVEGEPPFAERFELFIRGIELANGYHEVTDPNEIRRRACHNNTWRVRDKKQPLPVDSRLIDALTEVSFPECCGCALGFDRLVMIAVGAQSIEEVIAFPFERA